VHDADDDARPPASLLERLRADPSRAPELLALVAADRHGPRAAAWVAEQQRRGRPPQRVARRAIVRHARLARYGGAVTGLGGWMTILPDIAGLLWLQSRMVLCIAGAYGFDPTDRMRPAELLVIHRLYDDPLAAREALDGAGRSLALAAVDRAAGGDENVARRLTQMLGREAAERMAGKVIPGVASVFNALQNESDTRGLGDRAIAFYGGGR